MPSYVTEANVAGYLQRDLSAQDTATVTLLLNVAEAMVLAEGGTGLAAHISASGGLLPRQLQGVILAAVARAFTNPENMRSEQLGDYGYTSMNDRAGVYLTEDEKRLCRRWRPAVSSVRVRAYDVLR